MTTTQLSSSNDMAKETAPSLPATIENPFNGERITFLVNGQETNGEYVKAKIELPAEATGPPMVYHLAYTEAFEVLQGQLDLAIGGKKDHRVLAAGEKAFVPLSTLHRFWNSSNEPAVFIVEVRPARQFEAMMRAICGLANDGKANKAGPTNIWEFALFIILSESYVMGPPIFLQKGLFSLLGRIARWKGYDPDFSQYTRPQTV
jgi:mannose-6-phosphate isomerase-like protein (cupin superfamily)